MKKLFVSYLINETIKSVMIIIAEIKYSQFSIVSLLKDMFPIKTKSKKEIIRFSHIYFLLKILVKILIKSPENVANVIISLNIFTCFIKIVEITKRTNVIIFIKRILFRKYEEK